MLHNKWPSSNLVATKCRKTFSIRQQLFAQKANNNYNNHRNYARNNAATHGDRWFCFAIELVSNCQRQGFALFDPDMAMQHSS
jgi:hypothetical protein